MFCFQIVSQITSQLVHVAQKVSGNYDFIFIRRLYDLSELLQGSMLKCYFCSLFIWDRGCPL